MRLFGLVPATSMTTTLSHGLGGPRINRSIMPGLMMRGIIDAFGARYKDDERKAQHDSGGLRLTTDGQAMTV